MRVKDAVGRFGEERAAQHVEAAGLVILERNWRGRSGELDIVARDGSALVFIEVKTRSSAAFGSPAEAVDRRKAARIRRLAMEWMDARRAGLEPTFWSSVRFDVVSVVRRTADGLTVEHLIGAF
jgi:putative endonuclease